MRLAPRIVTITCLSIAPIIVAACGGSDSTTGPTLASVAGVYTLTTISGQPLPSQYGPFATDSMTDDQYTLHPDGGYDRIGHQRYYASGQERTLADIDSGTVSLYSSDSIRFHSRLDPNLQLAGTIGGGVLTLHVNPGPFVYRR